jgi:hypothetical protein
MWEAIKLGLTAIRHGRPEWARQAVWLAALSILALFEVPVALARMATWGYTVHRLGYSDFGQYFLWSRIGLHAGWNHLYDLSIQRQEWQALGGAASIMWWPIIEPPAIAWLVAPLALLPFPIAFAAWMTLILAAFALITRLVAPGTGLVRWTYVAAALAAYPVMFALLLGQSVILVAASVAASWWLLRRGRELEAGLVLVLILLKPNIALLVPVGLLVAGYQRAFLVWLSGAVVLFIATVLSLGTDGLSAYLARLPDALAVARDWAPASLSFSQLIGGTLPARALQLALALGVLRIIRVQRQRGPDLVVATGLLGSMLLTPYVHVPDLAVVLLAAAIFLHTNPTPRQQRVLAVLYVALVAILWTPDPWQFRLLLGGLIVLTELAWLGSIYLEPGNGRVQVQPDHSRAPA